ncbi:MAG: TonB-dependent receptor [Prevotellaceae bacterium]|nr:TonB-dependent receptor [Prevotellaceae bacterium]
MSATAQARIVTGVVKDASGEAVVGATVVAKGTTNSASTDVDGRYSISVPEGSEALVVSFLGMKTATASIAGSVVDVTLEEDALHLEEVVAIGYGTVKKSDLTGAVSSVNSDRLTAIGSTSVMSALQGATPGVDILASSARPGGGFSIQIRGQNSMNAGSPLYVVDGIVVDDIDFLSPSDIEQLDVLKDASSTAIYGSRGSNGVVIIKTKGASEGATKLTVSYDGYYGVRKLARVPDFMDGRELADYRTSMYYTWNSSAGKYELSDANKALVLQNSKIINTALYNQEYTDWLDLATDDGSQQSHSVNISGSSKDVVYNIGMGYQNEQGNFMREEMERYTMRASVSHKANKYFSSGANLNLSHTLVNGGSVNGYLSLFRMAPFFKAYDENGEYIQQPGTAASLQGGGNFTSSGNPLIEIESGSTETKRFNVMGSLFAELTPAAGLSIKTTFSPRLNQRRVGQYHGKTADPDYSSSTARTEHRTRLDWTWDNVISYGHTFADVHTLNVTLINSVYKTQEELLGVGATNFPYDAEWYNIFNGTLRASDNAASYSQVNMLSYAARVNYDYAGKYLVTGTVRYDGSSKLANKWTTFPSAAVAWRITEENFMKEAEWLSNLKLRASLGYSGNNNGVNAYGTQQTPNTGSQTYYDFDGNMVSGYAVGAPVNPLLTWEKTRELDLGLDVAFLGGRISGVIDFYDKLSNDLLMKRTLAVESGVVSMTDNIGSVNNRGIEIGLSTVNVKTSDWEWRTSFTFAHNKNAIRSVYGKEEDVPGEAYIIGQPISIIYGYETNGVYNYSEWAAATPEQRSSMDIANPGAPKIVDIDKNGTIDTYDRTILGKSNPDWTGSISSTLKYKGFDFSFNIYARQGVMVSDWFSSEFVGASLTDRGRPKVNFDYYIPEGAPRIDWSNFSVDADGQPWVTWTTSTEHASASYPIGTASLKGGHYESIVNNNGTVRTVSNGTLQDASFVKIRNITLGYTFPQKWIGKIKFSQARIYLNVLNPFTFTDYVGYDPEYAIIEANNGNGLSSIVYQLGVNLKF